MNPRDAKHQVVEVEGPAAQLQPRGHGTRRFTKGGGGHTLPPSHYLSHLRPCHPPSQGKIRGFPSRLKWRQATQKNPSKHQH
jgi:hypothetical protein